MAAYKDIVIFSEKLKLAVELIAGAHALIKYIGGEVLVIVAGNKHEAAEAIAAGADEVYWLDNKQRPAMVEDYVPSIAKFLQERKPFGILIGATRRGKAVAGRLGARLGASVITDVKEFEAVGKGLQLAHLIYGGKAMRFETHTSEIMMATVGMGVFQSRIPDMSRKGKIMKIELKEQPWKMEVQERKSKPSISANLTEAKKVICPGNGLVAAQDLTMIHELAEIFGAKMGCTRKLYEKLTCLPAELQVGITGSYIKPDLYIGIGISGQIQHTVGIIDSKIIVAINKDKNAPIFSQADYGIVGDLYEIVPALLKELKMRRKNKGILKRDSANSEAR